MKKLSIILSIVFLASMILASCNNQKTSSAGNATTEASEATLASSIDLGNTVEIQDHALLVYPTEHIGDMFFQNDLTGGSSFTYHSYWGYKSLNFRENYDMEKYTGKVYWVDDSLRQYKLYPFDILEVKLTNYHGRQLERYKVTDSLRGIAIKKANNKILMIIVCRYIAFETMRMRYFLTNDFGEIVTQSINNVPCVQLITYFEDLKVLQKFWVPLYEPNKRIEPVDKNNIAQFIYPEGNGIKPQKDSLIIAKCYGDRPRIDCIADGHSGSDIIIRGANQDGSDMYIHVDKAIYHYDSKGIYNITTQSFIDKNVLAGASFGLSNGRFLHILQAKDISRFTEYRKDFKVTYNPENPYKDKFVNWISIYNKDHDFFMLPRYLPAFP